MSKTIEGWHFTYAHLHGRETPRERGLHASTDILEALKHASGSYLVRVRLSGDIESGGTSRMALRGFDATGVLLAFARQCALDVAHLWDMPDVLCHYLETGDEELRDADRAAAWAASYAAMDVRDAARAARSAVWAVARSTATDERDAVWAAQRETLLTMIEGARP